MSDTIERTLLVFLDLETTGLDPDNDEVLEVGVVVLDSTTLAELGRESWLVRNAGKAPRMHPTVVEMHTKNGLLLDVANASWTHHAATPDGTAKSVLTFLRSFSGTRLVLAGNTVHFDRSFLERHMPELARSFYHRHCDVSAARTVLGVAAPKGEVGHRALADCDASIAEMKHLRSLLKEGAV